ncbi:MAG: GGDEF domain-containing protein [Pseudomonadota bacterium]
MVLEAVRDTDLHISHFAHSVFGTEDQPDGLIALADCDDEKIPGIVQSMLDEAECDNSIIKDHMINLARLAKSQAERSYTDGLTGLFNRRYLEQVIEQEIVRLQTSLSEGDRRAARSPSKGTALLAIDLDHFKALNDTYGHQAGDLALINVAQTLSALTRDHDIVVRNGGDEFIVLLKDIEPSVVEKRRYEIEDALNRVQFPFEGQMLSVHGSVGAAILNTEHNFESFMHEADQRLYDRKSQRRLER